MQPQEVEILMKTISNYEQVLFGERTEETSRTSMTETISPSSIQQLISLYNKAIEYYSAMNDERHMEFLQKLQKLLTDEKMQKILDTSDKGMLN